MAILSSKKASDDYEYYFMSAEIMNGDWVFNVNKDEVHQVKTIEEALKLNSLNKDFGIFLYVIHATDNPELIKLGIDEKLSDKVWYMRLDDDLRNQIIDKYKGELDGIHLFDFRISYMRKRYENILTDAMVQRVSNIKEAAIKYAGGGAVYFNSEGKKLGPDDDIGTAVDEWKLSKKF